ncbi:hypothetical protein L3Q82_016382, partial [Scortum barcoo]
FGATQRSAQCQKAAASPPEDRGSSSRTMTQNTLQKALKGLQTNEDVLKWTALAPFRTLTSVPLQLPAEPQPGHTDGGRTQPTSK